MTLGSEDGFLPGRCPGSAGAKALRARNTESVFIVSPESRALRTSGHSPGLGAPSGQSCPSFSYGPVSSGGRKWLCLYGCRAARWRHALGALQEAAHLLCTIARGRLVLPQTLLKGLEGLRAGLADLTDDGVGGRALSDAHLEVVTVALPRLRLGRNTLAILFQLSAAVAGSDLQGRLHVEAGAWEQ